MKKARTKSRPKTKGPKAQLSSAALRDLELMNPVTRRVKGGLNKRVSRKG